MEPEKDIYFQKAIEEGYLARSAYKLLQIDEVFNVFDGVTKAVDLCSAPGSWTQVIYNKLHKVPNNYDDLSKLNPNVKIVSVDMMPMDHFAGVVHLQADISQYSTMKLILDEFHDKKVDIVVCDGAIDVVGMDMIDYFMHHRIFLSALYITLNILKTGGNFVMKVFIKKGQEKIIQKLKLFFENVCVVKPHCSRNKEAFAVCQGYMPLENFDPIELTPYVEYKNEDFSKLTGVNKIIVPYLCGSENITADMYKIKALSITDTCEAEKDLWLFLDSILKDHQDDVAMLRERVSKTLPVFEITKDNELRYDRNAIRLLFDGLRCKKQNEKSETSEKACNSQEENQKNNAKCEKRDQKDGEMECVNKDVQNNVETSENDNEIVQKLEHCKIQEQKNGEMEHATKEDAQNEERENDAEICQKIEQCKIEDQMDDEEKRLIIKVVQNEERPNDDDQICQKIKAQKVGEIEDVNTTDIQNEEISEHENKVCQKIEQCKIQDQKDEETEHVNKDVQNDEETSENDKENCRKIGQWYNIHEELIENEVEEMLNDKTHYQDLKTENCYFNTEIDGKHVSDILKEKVNDIRLEKQGKDLDFSLKDWNFFCKGTDIEDVEIFKCEEITNIYKEFEEIEEELRQRPELSNAYFAKDLISKQEKIKEKIRNHFLDVDNSK